MRVVQGAGAAIVVPTVLSLIATGFPTERERNRAFAVFAGVSGAGGAIGLVAGGLLTEWVSWRWVLLVNVPSGVALCLAAPLFIGKSPRSEGRFDCGGAITSTGGVALLVYGFIHASESGWREATTIGSFVGAVVLLAAFVLIESRTSQPIIPLRLFASRNRSGIYALGVAMMGSLIGMFFFLTLFFLTLFFQNVLAYSPLKTGLAFLPLSVSIIIVSGGSAQRHAADGRLAEPGGHHHRLRRRDERRHGRRRARPGQGRLGRVPGRGGDHDRRAGLCGPPRPARRGGRRGGDDARRGRRRRSGARAHGGRLGVGSVGREAGIVAAGKTAGRGGSVDPPLPLCVVPWPAPGQWSRRRALWQV
ncbi:hypothetical protein GCM10010330_35410 [Streptomyces tendae]|uniref:MFS transporter n=1 Tax=Streptomyces tendae TaxID=1932 RepID=UPI001677B956|nr:MFS transporter [Streptomyces tendae]GHA78668.1 hypothetical protein GCM10010330_35410 [Streptomyces tendae]